MSVAQSEAPVFICFEHDAKPSTVAAFVAGAVQDDAPLLAWAEPDVRAVSFANPGGRIVGFHPLVRGRPDWADVPIAEARLFWANTALHIVADGNGCRYVRCSEGQGTEEVARQSYFVHTLRDRLRFGLTQQDDKLGELTVVEYRKSGHLVAWRLIPGGE